MIDWSGIRQGPIEIDRMAEAEERDRSSICVLMSLQRTRLLTYALIRILLREAIMQRQRHRARRVVEHAANEDPPRTYLVRRVVAHGEDDRDGDACVLLALLTPRGLFDEREIQGDKR